MFLIARIDMRKGAETEWFVAFSLDIEQVQVTRARQHARRFKTESDALSVKDKVSAIAPEFTWKIVSA